MSSHTTQSIQSARNGGQPLPESLQPTFEDFFDFDLTKVRLHTDHRADTLNQDLGARAFATGTDVFFRNGEFRPETSNGLRLLGHELAHIGQQAAGSAETIQRTMSEDEAASIARQIHGPNDYGPLTTPQMHESVRLLRVHNEDVRTPDGGPGPIRRKFNELYGTSLRDFIRDRFPADDINDDYQIRATALLFDPTYLLPHTGLALALIPLRTRDEEFWRFMYHTPLEGRRRTERLYNERFRHLGHGSLWADIENDFEGEEEIRAHIMLHRDLTDADRLYLVTAGQYGTDVDRALGILRQNWARGPGAFKAFVRQWNPSGSLPDVVPGIALYDREYFSEAELGSIENTTNHSYASRSLMYTVLSELSGASRDIAANIFLQFLRSNDLNQPSSDETSRSTPNAAAFTEAERRDLELEEANLDLASEGIGTNMDEFYRALRRIGEIYRGRIARLQQAGAGAESIEQARRDWERRESIITRGEIAGEMDTDYETLRARLTLSGIDDADRLYLNRDDYDQLMPIAERIFRQGRMDQVTELAGRAKNNQSGETIRPAFTVGTLVSATRGDEASRYYLITRNDRNDAARGAYRLQFEMEKGASDETLRQISNFLVQHDWRAGLRSEVLEAYCRIANRVGDIPPEARFHIQLIQGGFEELRGWSALRDSIAPARSASERLDRAREDRQREHSVLGDISTRVYDAATGEDTMQVVDESFDRLRIFAGRAGASAAELQAFREVYGAERELSEIEYEGFQSRLESMRQARAAAAEYAALAVTITVEAALTAFTAGAAAPLLGSTIAQAVAISVGANMAGMVIQEALDSRGNDLVSVNNVQRLVVAAVGAGAGAWAAEGTRLGTQIEHVAATEMGRAALRAGFSQSLEQGTSVFVDGLRGQLHLENLEDAVIGILLSSAAAGISSEQIRERLATVFPGGELSELGHEALEDFIQNTVQNLGQETVAIARDGDTDGALQRLAGSFGTALRDTALGHVGRSTGNALSSHYTPEHGPQQPSSDHRHRPDRETPGHEFPRSERSPDEARENIGPWRRPDEETPLIHPTPLQMGYALQPGEAHPLVHELALHRQRIQEELANITDPFRQTLLEFDLSDINQTLQNAEHDPYAAEHELEQLARYLRSIDTTDPAERRWGFDRMPDMTVMQSANPTSRADAETAYSNSIADDPLREAAVYRNSETGEYIVVQGAETVAAVGQSTSGALEGPAPGGVAQRWKELLDAGQDRGHWLLEAHYHPVDPITGHSPITSWFPSGRGGDFSVLEAESMNAGNQPRASIVHFRTSRGMERTVFEFIPGAQHPYVITFPDPHTGTHRREAFADLDAYHRWFSRATGGNADISNSSGTATPWTAGEINAPREPSLEESGLSSEELHFLLDEAEHRLSRFETNESELSAPRPIIDIEQIVARAEQTLDAELGSQSLSSREQGDRLHKIVEGFLKSELSTLPPGVQGFASKKISETGLVPPEIQNMTMADFINANPSLQPYKSILIGLHPRGIWRPDSKVGDKTPDLVLTTPQQIIVWDLAGQPSNHLAKTLFYGLALGRGDAMVTVSESYWNLPRVSL